MRPSRSLILALFFFVVAVFVALPAAADPQTEKEAKELRRQAVEEDSLGMNYTGAIDKLTQAASKCGNDKCGKTLRAQLQQDIGFMQYNATHDDTKTVQSFTASLKIDPNIALATDYKTGEIEALWEQAKKSIAAPATTSTTPDTSADAGAPATGGTPTGNFLTTPPAEGQNRTPLPIYVEYTGTSTLTKVEVRYKGNGMTAFKSVVLEKIGDGYGGLIPCEDVITGNMLFFVQGTDAEGNAETYGNTRSTLTVPIKAKFEDEPPHLPGQAPPQICPEKGDCPEGLVGCHNGGSDSDKKDEGAECEDGDECKSGKCENQQCTAPEEAPSAKSPFPRWWVGGGISIDLMFIGSSSNVCVLNQVSALPLANGYYCTTPDGANFPPTNNGGAENKSIVPNDQDQVKGGVALGPIHFMASLDYAVNANMMVGARLGYVYGTYPGTAASGNSFPPLHAEIRGSYLFGDGLMKTGFVPFLMAGAGLSEYAAHVNVNVVETGAQGPKTEQAWAVDAPAFLVAGAGIRFQFSPRNALVVPLKLTIAIGGAGAIPVISPEFAYQHGF